MQLLFLANEKLREDQRHQLDLENDLGALKSRFLAPEEFQITALEEPCSRYSDRQENPSEEEQTIPPLVAFQQLMAAMGSEKMVLPAPEELENVADLTSHVLPPKCCVLLMHRNLIPVAFKQKVLQVSNAVMQRSLQDRAMGPQQILAMLSGQDIRPFVVVEVSRENIVEDTARFLRQTDAAALHLPLKVRFAGEEGQDEGPK
eukprot:s5650_g1.t1